VAFHRALFALCLILSSCANRTQLTSQSPDPSRSTLTSDRTGGVLANGTDDAVLTATVVNAEGLPLPGLRVAFSAIGDGAAFTAAAATDENGKTTARVSATAAGVKVVTAAIVGGAALVHTVSVEFVAGPGAKLAFVVPPSDVQAAAPMAPPVQVAVEDSFGNVVADAGAPITVALELDGGAPSLGGTTTVGAASGIASFSDLNVEFAGTGYVLSASAGGLAAAVSSPFDVTAGPPASLAFTVSPSGVVNSASIAPAVQVTLRGPLEAPDPGGTAIVSLALGAGCGASGEPAHLSGIRSVAAVGGVATFSDLSIDRIAHGCTLVATAAGFAGAVSAPFDVNPGAPCAAQTTLTATPSIARADGIASVALAVTVRDCDGDLLSGEPVALSASGLGNTLSAASGASDLGGSFRASLSSVDDGDKTISATVGSGNQVISLSTVVTFTPGAASSSNSSIQATPSQLVADGVAASTVQIVARDLDGNPFSGAAVELTISGSGNQLSAAGLDAGATLSGTTGEDGSFSAEVSSTRAETKLLTATVGTGTTASALSTAITFVAGAADADQSSFAASPSSATVGSTLSLLVALADAQGNPLAGEALEFSADGSANTFSANHLASGPSLSGATSGSGLFLASLSSASAQLENVIVSVGGSALLTAPVAFTRLPSGPLTLSLSSSQSPVVADGAAATTLTATLLDSSGTPQPGVQISLSASGSANTFAVGGTASGASANGATDTSGQFIATLSSTKAETKSVAATTGAWSASVSVPFVAGPADVSSSLFVASPGVATADGVTQTVLFVQANDANGNEVGNLPVSLSLSGSSNTLSATAGTTNARGDFAATLSSTRAELKSVSATLGVAPNTIVLNTSVDFLPASTQPVVSITSSASTVVADGTTTASLAVRVTDASGNALDHQSVSLAASGSANTFHLDGGGFTDTSGLLSATLSSTKAEAKVVTATVGTTSNSTAVTFVAGPASTAQSSLIASPASIAIGGTITLFAQLADANGNPIAAQPLTLSADGANNLFSAGGSSAATASGKTSSSGLFIAQLSSSTPQTETVSLALGSSTSAFLTLPVTFAPTASSLHLSLVGSPAQAIADGASSSTLTLLITDPAGAPQPGISVTLTATGAGDAFDGTAGNSVSGSTDESGVFAAALTSTHAETKILTASAEASSAVATVTFIAGAPDPAHSALVATPNFSPAIADGTETYSLALVVQDAFGNPVGNQLVFIGAASGFTDLFTPNFLNPAEAEGTTDVDGAFAGTVASTTAGTQTLTAKIDNAEVSTSVSFAPGAPSATCPTLPAPAAGHAPNCTTLVWTNASATIVADGTSEAQLQLFVTDVFGNPVPGAATSFSATNDATGLANSGAVFVAPASTDDAGKLTASMTSTLANQQDVVATIGAGPGDIQTEANVQFACAAIANCLTETCTTGTDAVCTSCAESYYVSGGLCAACSGACAAGDYLSAACSADADRVCSACTPVAHCASGLTCTTASDQVCAVCDTGYQHCTGAVGGCETYTAGDINNCGACGNVCTGQSNASTYTCSSDACHIATCQPGYSDTNGIYSDGCETLNPAPSLASATITNGPIASSTTYNLQYGAVTGSYLAYCILENDTDRNDCSWIPGTLPSTFPVTSTNNAKVLSIWIRQIALNTSARVDTNSVLLDTVPPAVSGLSFNPAPSQYSMISTPTVLATVTEVNTPTTTFYVSSSATPDCTGTPIGSTSSSAINLQLSSVGATGPKFIHYISQDNASPPNGTGCVYSGLNYNYVSAPLLQVTQATYGILESDGLTWMGGHMLQLTRTDGNGHAVYDASTTVTVKPVAVVTQSGFSTAPINVTFAPTDTTQSVSSSSFAITNNSTVEQDSYFKVQLTSPTGGTIGPQGQAKIFIIDDETAGDIMFADTLFSANQSAGTVAVRMWRTGSTASAASATLDFRDGSAVGGTDYNNTPIAVTFPAGQSELIQDISITDHHSSSGGGASFYIQLDAPSTSTRPQSMAKVRILNDRDTTVCDPTNTNALVNGGFGGGAGVAGNPYLVCSSAQLANVQTNLSSYYRVMADIDASALAPSTASFTGSFDGNERILNNFAQANTTAAAGALFGTLAGQSTLQNLNFENFSFSCTSAATCGGIVFQTDNSATDNAALSNLYLSGYLSPSSVADYGMILGYAGTSDPTKTLAISNVFAAGLLVNNATAGGAIVGALGTSGSVNITNAMSVAYLNAPATSSTVSGIAATVTLAANQSLTLQQLQNRGLVNNCIAVCGGIVANLSLGAGVTANLNNLLNQGSMAFQSTSNNVAGIFSSVTLSSNDNVTLDTLSNTGNLINSTTVAHSLSGMAGIIGGMGLSGTSTGITFTARHLKNSGTITNHGNWTGGILGNAIGSGGAMINSTFTYTDLNNSGAVSAISQYLGGILGSITSLSGSSSSSITFTDIVNTGPITSTFVSASASIYVGGLLGNVNLSGGGTGVSLSIDGNSYNTGNVSGGGTVNNLGGLLGNISVANSSSVSVTSTAASAVTSAVTVSGQSNLGGVVGSASYGASSSILISGVRSDAAVTGTTNASSYAGGIAGIITGNGSGSSLTITNCTNTGAIRQGNYVGGAIGSLSATGVSGNNSTATLSGLVSTGNVDTYSKSALATSNGIGGLIGAIASTNYSSVALSHSSASGNVNALSQTDVAVLGGLIGQTGCTATSACSRTIATSSATGTVTGGQAVGGFIGNYLNCGAGSTCVLTIGQASSTGTVTDNYGGTYFGGFIGEVTNPGSSSSGNLTISNAYTLSQITSFAGGANYGVFIGRILNTGNVSISTSYAYANIAGPVAGTGFVQTDDGTIIASDNYSLTTNPADATPVSTQLNLTQFLQEGSFVGFDFTTVPYWNPPTGSAPPTLH